MARFLKEEKDLHRSNKANGFIVVARLYPKPYADAPDV